MYTIVRVFQTTKQVELVKKKEFTAAVPDSDNKTFVVYIASLANFDVHPFYKA